MRLLDSPVIPELYIAPGEINAITAGVERPLIVLYAGAVDLLTPEELLFVMAHEVGHIKSAHVLYYQIAEFIPVIGEIVGAATFGLGEFFGAGLQLALLRWKRMSEYTADRAGLLACKDAEVALRTMMKLAGLPAKSMPQSTPRTSSPRRASSRPWIPISFRCWQSFSAPWAPLIPGRSCARRNCCGGSMTALTIAC